MVRVRCEGGKFLYTRECTLWRVMYTSQAVIPRAACYRAHCAWLQTSCTRPHLNPSRLQCNCQVLLRDSEPSYKIAITVARHAYPVQMCTQKTFSQLNFCALGYSCECERSVGRLLSVHILLVSLGLWLILCVVQTWCDGDRDGLLLLFR
jgi:hypothetical protein